MVIWSYMLIFFIGLVIGIIIGYKNSRKYNRNCTNCKYSTFAESKDGVIRLYCQRAIDVAGSVLPIKDYDVCGHFDYTDEIKTEQVKEQAEKMVKFTKEYNDKYNDKDRK